MPERKSRRVNILRVGLQLTKWGLGILYFGCMALLDKVLGRSSMQRTGVRMRRTIEWLGGTMVKIGQQLSMRVDILPYVICEELGKLLDDQAPFPHTVALAKIEAMTGQKTETLFKEFEPVPVGSASIACVFKAQLTDGTPVAIKVRRPGIYRKFVADLKALDIICQTLELLTILRPGFTKPFRAGLSDALLEEMDFRLEARYQRLFCKRMEEVGDGLVTAPKVYTALSGDEVITMEYVEGMPLTKVLTALEKGSDAQREMLREWEIDPPEIARRILRVSHMSMITEPFFHADPHPANIILQRDGRLVLIDFGACGAFSSSQRLLLQQINYYQMKADPEGMARATIELLRPLPPIDVRAFSLEIEKIYRLSVFAMADPHAEWWERTTASHWLAFMRIAIKYGISLPIGFVHMVRATMIYDTIATRLDHQINFYEEFRKFQEVAGKMARKRLLKGVKDAALQGIEADNYLRLEQLHELGQRRIFQLQNALYGDNFTGIRSGLSKGSYFLTQFVRFGAFAVALLGFLILARIQFDAEASEMSLGGHLGTLMSHSWVLAILIVGVIIFLRRVMFRLNDKDT